MKNAGPIVALLAGIALLFVSVESIKFVLAVYLIVIGILGLVGKKS